MRSVSVYKWIVPAQVAGVWEWDGLDDTRYRVDLQQKYQEITGSAWLAGEAAVLKSAKLCGGCLELEIQQDETSLPHTFTLNFEQNELQSILEDA